MSLTSALKSLGGRSRTRARRFTSGTATRYRLYRKLDGPHGRSGQMREISSHRNSIYGPSSPWRVAIPTDLSIGLHWNMWKEHCGFTVNMIHIRHRTNNLVDRIHGFSFRTPTVDISCEGSTESSSSSSSIFWSVISSFLHSYGVT